MKKEESRAEITPEKRGTRLPRRVHFWIIVGMMVVGAMVYYHELVPGLTQLVVQLPLVRYPDFLRILNLVPIAYAAYVFGLRAGIIITAITTIAVLPYAVLEVLAGLGEHSLSEILAVLALGIAFSWLIDRLQQERSRLRKTSEELEALHQALLHHARELEAEKRRLETIHAVQQAVNQSLEVERVLEYALDKTLEMTGFELGGIFILEEGDALVLRCQRGLSPRLAASLRRVPVAGSISGRAVLSGQPVVVPDYTAAADGMPVVKEAGIRFTSFIPIKAEGKVIGVLNIGTRSAREAEPEDISMMEVIGLDIGVAIRRGLLYAQLQEREEEYRALIEQAGDPIVIVEPATGRILDVNTRGVELLGYGKAELQGKHILELSSPAPEALEAARLAFQEVIEKGQGVLKDMPALRKDGSLVSLEVVAKTVSFRGREVIMVIGRDISQRKQMEEAIRQMAEAERTAKETALALVRHTNEEKQRLQESVVQRLEAMASFCESRIPATTGHSEKVRRYATAIARNMSLSEREVAIIGGAARLHALGLYILQDPSLHLSPPTLWPPSTADEHNMRLIVERTLELIEPLGFLQNEAAIIRAMNETYDGRGYPEGLKGGNIPLGARVLAVAHAFDLLTRESPRRKSLSPEEALREVGKYSGTLFDPMVVEALEATHRVAQHEIDEGI